MRAFRAVIAAAVLALGGTGGVVAVSAVVAQPSASSPTFFLHG